MHITSDMVPFLIIAALFCFFMLASIFASGGRRRRTRRAQALGEIRILDDRGSDHPTIAMKRRRD